jgi:hypothetical protein
MRGSLRIHSLTSLALLLGWSLVACAREFVTAPGGPSARKTTGPPPAERPLAVDPRVWN